ncbi:hypothetical protein HK107_15145 [Parvularcula sp. ZS-1/3]|uniref:Uncharacterized protein n=1 Tax=Parvularcula mediterranea TaxID=2732508 RepID=A0A7Y3RQ44_9PROT|nr:hypothetical protein [Parvularcula mediterranea]NNU17666.1 hypothetical protein [Parvularcula mediterranea]
MEQLLYVFSLGFSGSDATRAIILLLIGALFVTNKFPAWKVTVILLIIDQAWPYVQMLREGDGHKGVEIALRGQAMHWQDVLAGFLVRAAGFYVFIRGTFSLRRKLHNAMPDEGGGKLLPF